MIEFDPTDQEKTQNLKTWYGKYRSSGLHVEAITQTGRDAERTSRSDSLPLWNIVDIHNNLPNDEEVQLKKGSRRLQLKNSMRAKFDKILVPIADLLLVPEQRKHIVLCGRALGFGCHGPYVDRP